MGLVPARHEACFSYSLSGSGSYYCRNIRISACDAVWNRARSNPGGSCEGGNADAVRNQYQRKRAGLDGRIQCHLTGVGTDGLELARGSCRAQYEQRKNQVKDGISNSQGATADEEGHGLERLARKQLIGVNLAAIESEHAVPRKDLGP